MQKDSDSKWEFDAPKFWDFTGILQQSVPSDSWFSEKTVSGPSFPQITKTFKKRLAPHDSLTTKNYNSAKRYKVNEDVFSRLANTKTTSSAIKSSTHKSIGDNKLKSRRIVSTKSTIKEPQAASGKSKIPKQSEDKPLQSAPKKLPSYTPQTPPDQIRSSYYEPDTPPPPSPGAKKNVKRTDFTLLHKQHKEIINDLRERINESVKKNLG